MADELVVVNPIEDDQAMVNVTYNGQNGELADPVFYDSTDADVKAWVTEAVRNGDIAAIGRHPNANFADFVVERYPPQGDRPHNLIMLRPKTPFGA